MHMENEAETRATVTDKVSVLLAIRDDSSREMTRFRDIVWKVNGASFILLSASAVFLSQPATQTAICSEPRLKILLAAVPMIFLAGLGILYWHSERSLRFHRIPFGGVRLPPLPGGFGVFRASGGRRQSPGPCSSTPGRLLAGRATCPGRCCTDLSRRRYTYPVRTRTLQGRARSAGSCGMTAAGG